MEGGIRLLSHNAKEAGEHINSTYNRHLEPRQRLKRRAQATSGGLTGVEGVYTQRHEVTRAGMPCRFAQQASGAGWVIGDVDEEE